MSERDEFRPDWTSPPGDTIVDILEERDVSVSEFARQIGSTFGDAQELLHGRLMITLDTARRLERAIGGSAEFWMLRETQYRTDLDRVGAEQQRHDLDWLKEIPVRDMTKFGWLEARPNSNDRLKACLQFFGVPNVQAWRGIYGDVLATTAYKTSRSFDQEPGAVAAWLRRSEIESESMECEPWSPERFEEALHAIRGLTRKKDPKVFIPELVGRCAACGVAVVVERAPTGCRASGATRFVSPTKALLVLSFRYLSDDHFWFAFFHEAGHLLLHGKRALFLEGYGTTNKEEDEANAFAARILIPREFQATLPALRADSLQIIKFARQIGIAPGIVVGQLQHAKLVKPEHLNRLKRRYRWT